jgi:hypothetical protein
MDGPPAHVRLDDVPVTQLEPKQLQTIKSLAAGQAGSNGSVSLRAGIFFRRTKD